MGAEVLLYAYGLVCLSMLVFNLIYGLYLRTDDRRRQRRIGRLRRRMESQLNRLGETTGSAEQPLPVRQRHVPHQKASQKEAEQSRHKAAVCFCHVTLLSQRSRKTLYAPHKRLKTSINLISLTEFASLQAMLPKFCKTLPRKANTSTLSFLMGQKGSMKTTMTI